MNQQEAIKALDILSAQVGNARLRKMWSEPLKEYLLATCAIKTGDSGQDESIHEDDTKDDE